MPTGDITIREIGWRDAPEISARFADSPQQTPYSSPGWLELTANTLSGRVYLLTAFKGDDIWGYMPIWEIRHPLLGKIADIPPTSTYWGPVLKTWEPGTDSNPVRETLGAFATTLARLYPAVRTVCHYTIADVRPFLWTGWSASPRYTGLISFSDAAEYCSGMDRKMRKKIALAEGFTTTVSTDPGPYFSLHTYTYERQNMALPVSNEAIRKLAAIFPDTGRFHYLHNDKNTVVAARYALLQGSKAYDMLAAAGPDGRGNHGAYLLWNVLSTYCPQGYVFDVQGLNFPNIAGFKERFPLKLTGYFLLHYRRGLAAKALYNVRVRVRR